jgi:hypothetical protein
MFFSHFIDLVEETFFHCTRRFGVLISISSVGFQLAAGATILCMFSLVSVLQSLVSLESGHSGSQRPVLIMGHVRI